MCKECVSKLSRAFSFRKQCREADEFLRSEIVKSEQEDSEYRVETLDEYCEVVEEHEPVKEEVVTDEINVDYVYEAEYLEPALSNLLGNQPGKHSIELCVDNSGNSDEEVVESEYTVEEIDNNVDTSMGHDLDEEIFENNGEIIIRFHASSNQDSSLKLVDRDLVRNKKTKKNNKTQRTANNEWLCDECGKVSKTKDSHNYHILKVHNPEEFKRQREKYFGQFECEHCGRKFHNRIMYKRHLNIHDPNNPNVCEVCGKIYADKSTLASHMLSHMKEKPFKCEVCGKQCDSIKNWENHMRFHTGERPYKVMLYLNYK